VVCVHQSLQSICINRHADEERLVDGIVIADDVNVADDDDDHVRRSRRRRKTSTATGAAVSR
jgi:hypothetical protein